MLNLLKNIQIFRIIEKQRQQAGLLSTKEYHYIKVMFFILII